MLLVLAQSSSSYTYNVGPAAYIANIVFLGLGIWVAVDANKYPDYVWQQAGQNKVVWQVVPIVVGLCCGCFGLIPVLIYFLNIKKKLDQFNTGGGGYGGGYGGGGYPPPGGGYPTQGYPPASGGYPPQSGGYPPEQPGGGYPPQQ